MRNKEKGYNKMKLKLFSVALFLSIAYTEKTFAACNTASGQQPQAKQSQTGSYAPTGSSYPWGTVVKPSVNIMARADVISKGGLDNVKVKIGSTVFANGTKAINSAGSSMFYNVVPEGTGIGIVTAGNYSHEIVKGTNIFLAESYFMYKECLGNKTVRFVKSVTGKN